MNSFDRVFLACDQSSLVHQTGTVGAGDVFCPGVHVMSDLVTAHLCRYVWFFYTEHSTETATFVRMFRLDHFNALDKGKQIAQLVEIRNMEFAWRGQMHKTDTVATVLQTHFVREVCLE